MGRPIKTISNHKYGIRTFSGKSVLQNKEGKPQIINKNDDNKTGLARKISYANQKKNIQANKKVNQKQTELSKTDLNKYYNEVNSKNKNGVDVWIQLAPYLNWIQNIAFKGDDKFNCYRPVDRESVPDPKKRKIESNRNCERL